MHNGHIKIDIISDIDKDLPSPDQNQALFEALPIAEKKKFADRFDAVITPSPLAVKEMA